jgi:hypothetical protein
MPRSLAEGHIKLSIMSVAPANLAAPTLAELNAGIDAAARILNSDFQLGASASDKISEKSLAQEGNSNTLGASNYDGGLTVFRYFTTATGAPEASAGGNIGDSVYQAIKTKGTQLWIAKRFTSKKSTEAWATGDPCEVFVVITDNPVDAAYTGYIKSKVDLQVQDAVLNAAVVAA